MMTFTYWDGPMPEAIRICLSTIQKRVPNLRVLNRQKWETIAKEIGGGWLDPRIWQHHPRAYTNAMRFVLLWHYGGYWVDTDIFMMKPIDPLFDLLHDNEMVCVDEKDIVGYHWMDTYFFGMQRHSELGHEILDRIWELTVKPLQGEWKPTFNGSHILSKYWKRCHLLPASSFYPIHWTKKAEWFEDEPYTPGDEYGAHLSSGVINNMPKKPENFYGKVGDMVRRYS